MRTGERGRETEIEIGGFRERGVHIHDVNINFSKQEDTFLLFSNSLHFE